VMTAPYIGVRESRRILGEYVITDEDIVTGRSFEDGICDVTFGIDVHATNKKSTTNADVNVKRAQPYQIPVRSLIAKDVKGLLLAGRCISGSFYAHSSYRVTGDACVIGEAAGKEAARLAVK